jgi:hypothetical protein
MRIRIEMPKETEFGDQTYREVLRATKLMLDNLKKSGIWPISVEYVRSK